MPIVLYGLECFLVAKADGVLGIVKFNVPLEGPLLLWVLSQPCRSCSCVVSCHLFM